MDSPLYFRPTSGMGDKLFDLIGFIVLCKYINRQPIVEWCEKYEVQPWGIAQFDKRLFDFGINLVQDIPDDYERVISTNTCVSISIPKLYEFLKTRYNIVLEYPDLINTFTTTFKKHIVPSNITLKYIPHGIEKCIGVHLRKSDKIREDADTRHEMKLSEYEELMKHLRSYVTKLIKDCKEKEISFFVCSEDYAHKRDFQAFIKTTCDKYNIVCSFVEPSIPTAVHGEYINIAAVVDMFSLSKCKCILQGIKYSTFSMIASIIGNVSLHNFAVHDNRSLIHIWKPCLSFVNHVYDLDLMVSVGNMYPGPRYSTDESSSVQPRQIMLSRYIPHRFLKQ